MKTLFLITLDAKINREDIVKYLGKLKGFGTWFYSMPGSFFIYSSLNVKEIGEEISKYCGKEDRRYFITKLTGASYWGWMPKEHWGIVNNNGAEKRYDLQFFGYYGSVSDLPEKSGIYCVYSGVLNHDNNKVLLKKLLYIGKAQNIRMRHTNHERRNEWRSMLSAGESLWYTYTEVVLEEMDRCEAALISINKPICNEQGLNSFGYYDTYISVSGAVALLKNDQVVEQTK